MKEARSGVYFHKKVHLKVNKSQQRCTYSLQNTLFSLTLAMRLRSSFLTLRTAMAPASTKYLRHRSSMPFVVRIT